MFGMGLFVVSKITWLIQQTCDDASTDTRELVEMVGMGNVGLLAAQLPLLLCQWGDCIWSLCAT